MRTLEEGVGIRLEPDDLAEPGRLGRFDAGHVPLLGRASAGRAARVEAPVGGDPVEPGAQRGASLEPAEALPGGQQRVLQGVLGVLERSEHPVAVHLQLPPVRLGQLAERVAVAGPRPRRSGRLSPLARRLPLLHRAAPPSPYGHRPRAELGGRRRPVSRRRGVYISAADTTPTKGEPTWERS